MQQRLSVLCAAAIAAASICYGVQASAEEPPSDGGSSLVLISERDLANGTERIYAQAGKVARAGLDLSSGSVGSLTESDVLALACTINIFQGDPYRLGFSVKARSRTTLSSGCSSGYWTSHDLEKKRAWGWQDVQTRGYWTYPGSTSTSVLGGGCAGTTFNYRHWIDETGEFTPSGSGVRITCPDD